MHSCTHWLRPRLPLTLPPHLGSYTRALLVSQDRRRHLFVTPVVSGFVKFISKPRGHFCTPSEIVWVNWSFHLARLMYLKGQCHEIFCFWFFSGVSFSPAQEYPNRTVSNFSDWRFFAFATGVNDTSGALWAANISANFRKNSKWT